MTNPATLREELERLYQDYMKEGVFSTVFTAEGRFKSYLATNAAAIIAALKVVEAAQELMKTEWHVPIGSEYWYQARDVLLAALSDFENGV